MSTADLRELESLFLALGDKTRLKLLGLMANGPVAVGLLAEKIAESQPKVSRHLAYLRNAGVVSTERDGKYIYYRIETPEDERVNAVLASVIDSLADKRRPRTEKRRVERVVKHREEPAETAADIEFEEIEGPKVYEAESERDELEVFLL